MIAVTLHNSGVLLLDSDLNLCHTYHEVNASRAVFDQYGHVLVLDESGTHIHVVDSSSGKHLKTYTIPQEGTVSSMFINRNGDCVISKRGLEKFVNFVGKMDPNTLVSYKYLK